MTQSNKPLGPSTTQILRTGRVQAIKNLIADLQEITEVENADELRGARFQDETEFYRVMSVHMLGAFEMFLRRIGRPEAVPDALMKLTTALSDAELGINHYLLTPRRSGGRPPIASDELNLQGRVAAVQDFLTAKCWEKEKAATFVFRALGSDAVDTLRAHNDKRTPNWHTVDRWRTAVFEGSKKISMGSGFEDMKTILSGRDSQGDPSSVAKEVLSILRDQISSPSRKLE